MSLFSANKRQHQADPLARVSQPDGGRNEAVVQTPRGVSGGRSLFAAATEMKAPLASPAGAKKAVKPKQDDGDGLGRLTRLGFTRLAECLLSIPKNYYDYTKPISVIKPEQLEAAMDGKGLAAYLILRPRAVRLFDVNKRPTRWGRGAFRLEVDCVDANKRAIKVVIFGNVWPWRPLCDALEDGHIGAECEPLHLHGQLKVWRNELRLSNPHVVAPQSRGKVTPVYAGKPGQVSGDALASAVLRAMPEAEDAEIMLLAQAGLRASEFDAVVNSVPLPKAIPDVKVPADLLDSLHLPETLAEGLAACDIARRLSVQTIVRKAVAAKSRSAVPASSVVISRKAISDLIESVPFSLTGDQVNAIDEIVEDLRSPYPMNRLLSGDVGTGKSITFMVPAVAVAMTNVNVAILVPSQLLVSQISSELRSMFPCLLPGQVVPMTGGSKIPAGSQEGRIFVGTTALISAARKAKLKFSLVITDEQHKFSVDQKSAMVGKDTNVLDATATAIPRTLALVTFGGMDVSVLRQSPVSKEIKTRVVHSSDEARVKEFVSQVVARGGQAAIIYPLVASASASQVDPGGQDVDDALMLAASGASGAKESLQSVIKAGGEWERDFPGRVGVLHGKLTAEEKGAVIQGMTEGRFDVLVSSLVIEVGVTLPSLKAIVINHSDRFGLAQLHQLRGRVARKGGRGYMFLLTDEQLEPSEDGETESMARLRLLERCSDGFALAEADMDMRGFGDVAQDSELQNGSARTLFHNAKLTHQEIAKMAKEMGAL